MPLINHNATFVQNCGFFPSSPSPGGLTYFYAPKLLYEKQSDFMVMSLPMKLILTSKECNNATLWKKHVFFPCYSYYLSLWIFPFQWTNSKLSAMPQLHSLNFQKRGLPIISIVKLLVRNCSVCATKNVVIIYSYFLKSWQCDVPSH